MEYKKTKLSSILENVDKINITLNRLETHSMLLHKLIDERADLIIKWRKIEIMIGSELWYTIDKPHQKLLYKQHSILTEYVLVLNDRIQLLINKPIGEI